MTESHKRQVIEHKTIEEKIKSVRSEILTNIKTEKPLFLALLVRNGDDFIRRAAYMQVLKRLCTEEEIMDAKINFTTTNKDNFDLLHQIPLSQYSSEKTSSPVQKKYKSLYVRHMESLAWSLGVTLTPDDYESIPALVSCDTGPLKNYDEAVVAQRADELRNEIRHREIIIISQAGSEAMKRPSTSQVKRIASTIRSTRPNAYIILLSDRPLLIERYKRAREAMNGRISVHFPIAIRVTDSEKYTQLQVDTFKSELSSSPVPKDDNEFDRVVDIDTDSINELLAYMRVAELGISTDGYWMHLAASQGLKTVALFTQFRAAMWAPLSTIAVESDLLAETRQGEPYSWLEYSSKSDLEGGECGINNFDIDRLEQVVVDTLQQENNKTIGEIS